MSGVRCFVGVTLETAVAQALAGCRGAIVSVDHAWRDDKWVAPENLHLTLHFIGDVHEDDLSPVAERIGAAVEPHLAFEIPFLAVTASPNTRRARMLWAHFADPESACARLAHDIARATSCFGEPSSERAFRAHVTLCRARRAHKVKSDAIAAASELVAASVQSMSVPSATLIASRLTPQGPVYTEISMWRLRGH